MLTPELFVERLFDDWMSEFPFAKMDNSISKKLYGKHAGKEMLTDVKELDDHYEVDIDLPGFKKEDVNIELKDGCLVIMAAKGLDEDEKDKDGRIIRQERYSGMLSRSFYVGDKLTTEDIKAKFEDGVLRLDVAKKDLTQIPSKNTILIE